MNRRIPITLFVAAVVGVLGCGELPSGIDDNVAQFARGRSDRPLTGTFNTITLNWGSATSGNRLARIQ